MEKVDTEVSSDISTRYDKAAAQDNASSLAWEKPVPKQAQNQLSYKPIPNVDTAKDVAFGSVIASISRRLHKHSVRTLPPSSNNCRPLSYRLFSART
ncbi:MAG: hypothetical protein ACKVJE_14120 [Pseudomonadales bacterium]